MLDLIKRIFNPVGRIVLFTGAGIYFAADSHTYDSINHIRTINAFEAAVGAIFLVLAWISYRRWEMKLRSPQS